MFPQSFKARVAQRLAIWGAMLGFLLFLFTVTEVIRGWQAVQISADRQHATDAAIAHILVAGSIVEGHADRSKELLGAIEAINSREAGLVAIRAPGSNDRPCEGAPAANFVSRP